MLNAPPHEQAPPPNPAAGAGGAWLGATYTANGGLTFLVWAPLRKSVSLQMLSPISRTHRMNPVGGGYFSITIDDPGAPVRYVYALDDYEDRPDPASAFQPDGVHGPSMAVRHGAFQWKSAMPARPLHEYITYELHVGTFSPEGTFAGVIHRIPHLADLGVTAVEIMPVCEFPGARNWGYDGAYPFSAASAYGGPDGLRALVDALHAAGISVVLDVVYNHLGPEGNYLGRYAPYFTSHYRSPWGDAINFDGPESDHVRRYFIENALHWFRRYRMDALRLDAVHGIYDLSARHFLRDLAETVKAIHPGGILIAESDLGDVRIVDSPGRGGFGIHGQWLDDWHHAVHTLLSGESQGYYMDFGSAAHLAKSLSENYVYSGQYSSFRHRRHGNSASHIAPSRLMSFVQNHDQVGNRPAGDRLAATLDMRCLRLAAAAVVLGPFLPLIFMGEEYAERAPFAYFTSHSDRALAEAVRQGRKKEFAGFFKGVPETAVPDPQDEATFSSSKLDWGLIDKPGGHALMLDYYRALIALRKSLPALNATPAGAVSASALDDKRTVIYTVEHAGQRLLGAMNFSETEVEIARSQSPAPGGDGGLRLLHDSSAWPSEADTEHAKIGYPLRLPPRSFMLCELAGTGGA